MYTTGFHHSGFTTTAQLMGRYFRGNRLRRSKYLSAEYQSWSSLRFKPYPHLLSEEVRISLLLCLNWYSGMFLWRSRLRPRVWERDGLGSRPAQVQEGEATSLEASPLTWRPHPATTQPPGDTIHLISPWKRTEKLAQRGRECVDNTVKDTDQFSVEWALIVLKVMRPEVIAGVC